MKFTVEITAEAEAEIEEIYVWIHQHSPFNAARWRERLLAHAQKLSTFPKRCARALEAEAFGLDIRQLLYGNYRILFSVDRRTVHILHVRHGARRPLQPDPSDED